MSQAFARELGDVCDVIAGQHIAADLYGDQPQGVAYLTGPADFCDRIPIVTKWTTHPKVFAAASDVLITVKGAGVGKTNLGVDAAIGRQLMALRPRPNQLDRIYLFHFLRSRQKHINRLGEGATVPGIGKDDLTSLTIPLPPLDEQRRIAAILDAADSLRAKRRAALAKLDQLAQSIFIEMFGDPAFNPKGWPLATIGSLLSSANYGTSAKAGAEGDWAILRMNNITYDGRMDLRDLKYLDLKDSEIEKYTVRSEDILFNRTNSAELVGKTAVFRKQEPMAFAGYLIRLRCDGAAAPDYISAVLNSRFGKATLRGMCKSIIGMANINAKEVQSIEIPQPPIQLQKTFAERLQKLEVFRTNFRKSWARLDLLFASLQHRAFRGEL